MPLSQGKSPKAFSKNVSTEMDAGKPQKQALAIAYSVKRRAKKMAGGGMAHCAHGGPAHCNVGCYADGGIVEEMHPKHDVHQMEDAAKSEKQARAYEMGRDEPMNEMPNEPKAPMMNDMDSEDADEDGKEYFDKTDDPMKMAKGGMFHPKNMAKSIMKMAMGGMVNSQESDEMAQRRVNEMEDQPSSPEGMDEDIDTYATSPHDDYLTDEEEYPLAEEEGYSEGGSRRGKGKFDLISRVMSKLHSR